MAFLDIFSNLLSFNNADQLSRNNVGLLLNENPFSRDISQTRSSSYAASSDPNQVIPESQSKQTLFLVKFPNDLGNDYIQFDFAKYVRPNPADGGKFFPEFSVALPIPRVLTEQHTLNLTPQSLKTIDVIANEMGKDFIEKLNMTNSLETIGETAFSAASQFFMDSNRSLLGFSGEQVFGRFQQSLGFIPNPHMSVFFNGVDLRPAIEFSWLFTPKDSKESDSLKRVLKQIKKKSLPEVTSGNANIMNYPYMVLPSIVGPDPDMIPKYKRGLISAISINYTPNGPSFFKGTNSPTFIAFSFLFQEIEIFTSADYGGSYAASFSDRISDSPLVKNLSAAGQAALQQIDLERRLTGIEP